MSRQPSTETRGTLGALKADQQLLMRGLQWASGEHKVLAVLAEDSSLPIPSGHNLPLVKTSTADTAVAFNPRKDATQPRPTKSLS